VTKDAYGESGLIVMSAVPSTRVIIGN
jgi:hypothetical protein